MRQLANAMAGADWSRPQTQRPRRARSSRRTDVAARFGVGPDIAAKLIVAAGDNPERCGGRHRSPHSAGVPHPRLVRKTHDPTSTGGDRQANRALDGLDRPARPPSSRKHTPNDAPRRALPRMEITRYLKRLARRFHRSLLDDLVRWHQASSQIKEDRREAWQWVNRVAGATGSTVNMATAKGRPHTGR